MSRFRVLIRGQGIAAACAAHLLARHGIAVTTRPSARPLVPALLLGDTAVALIRGIFEAPGLLAEAPRVTRRIVLWGDAAETLLPHSAITVSEQALLDALPAPVPVDRFGDGGADVTLHAASPLPAGAMRRFGSRVAASRRVGLRDDRDACLIEAVADGWLFLLPGGGGGGEAWLLGVGAPIATLLAASRLVAPRIDAAPADAEAGPRFDVCPRLAMPPAGEDWLGIGSAALAFDPICGDGVALGLRSAILAAAVIAGIAEGQDKAALTDHYRAMLIAAMRRHLGLCLPFYRSGGDGDWWRGEEAALVAGHDWCTARLAASPKPRFALDGFRLRAAAG